MLWRPLHSLLLSLHFYQVVAIFPFSFILLSIFVFFFSFLQCFPFFLVYIMYGPWQNNKFPFSSQLALARVPNFISFTLALIFSSSVVAELTATHLVPSQLCIQRSVEDLWKPDRSISALSCPCSHCGFVFVFRHSQCSVSTSISGTRDVLIVFYSILYHLMYLHRTTIHPFLTWNKRNKKS